MNKKPWTPLLGRIIDALLVLLAIGIVAFFFYPPFFDNSALQLSMIIIVPVMTFLLERLFENKTLGLKLVGHGHIGGIIRSITLILILGSVIGIGITCQDLINTGDTEFFAGKDDVSENSWVKYTPEEKGYSVEFPAKPKAYQNELPIPRSAERMPFYEAKCKTGSDLYSLSYVVLPSRWLKWNSSLVMKIALKAITRRIPGAKVVKTSRRSFNKLPSIEFIVSMRGNMEVAGRLVLVKNRLYKLEVSYPKGKKVEMQPALNRFIHSFAPRVS
ncbi:MAG: hypothetical protein P0S94_04215 [Simkaniaceae bacterium]|nr:hypothetical protein [Simkaniaceae bacterium]